MLLPSSLMDKPGGLRPEPIILERLIWLNMPISPGEQWPRKLVFSNNGIDNHYR